MASLRPRAQVGCKLRSGVLRVLATGWSLVPTLVRVPQLEDCGVICIMAEVARPHLVTILVRHWSVGLAMCYVCIPRRPPEVLLAEAGRCRHL